MNDEAPKTNDPKANDEAPKAVERHSRIGYQMLKTFEGLQKDVLVVDHNPEVISGLLKRGVACVYGDIDDPD